MDGFSAATQPPAAAPPLQFAALVAGRPVRTDFVQVAPSRFTLSIVEPTRFSHVALFAFGPSLFPVGYAASVYVSFPEENPDVWKPLGYIANSKPSAIFKTANSTCSAILGVSIEPEELVIQTLAAVAAPSSSVLPPASADGLRPPTTTSGSHNQAAGIENPTALVQRVASNVVRNLFNFASSFVSTGAVIPLEVLQEWIKTLERKALLQPEIFLRDPNTN